MCQEANGGQWIGSIPEKYFKRLENNEYIWSPQYTLHKTLMGLLDVYEFTGYQVALEMLDNASEWYVNWVDSLKDKPCVVVKGEAGGMLEIWARLYGIIDPVEFLIHHQVRSKLLHQGNILCKLFLFLHIRTAP